MSTAPDSVNQDGTTGGKQLFVTLPFEIRQKIYRMVFLNTKPLGVPSGARSGHEDFGWEMPGFRDCDHRLEFPIPFFRVCRLVYHEASTVLYSENTFAFKIWMRSYEMAVFPASAPLRMVDHIARTKDTGFPIDRIRRYTIKVELQDDCDYWGVYRSSRMVCEVLAATPDLRSLHIDLELKSNIEDESLYRVLVPFMILRNIQEVKINGYFHPYSHNIDWKASPPPYFTNPLISLMKGSSPVEDIPEIYEDLCLYAKPFQRCEIQLAEVDRAMQVLDIDLFKRLREDIMKCIYVHEVTILPHSPDHDADTQVKAVYSSEDEESTARIPPLEFENDTEAEFASDSENS
ncbi:MAG: hypothetical protein Q9164_001448 [Protoblastenia rupestris]